MSIIRLSSSRELYWLARHFKHFPLPVVLYDDNCECCGYYHWPENIYCIGSVEIEASNGIIVLGCDPNEGTIAHEYRHHLQYWSRGKTWYTDLSLLSSVEYWSQPAEEDALRFEVRMGVVDSSLMFQELAKVRVPSRSDLINYIPTRW